MSAIMPVLPPTPLERALWEGDRTLDVAAAAAKVILLYALLRVVLRRLIDALAVPIVAQGEKHVDGASAPRLKTLAGLLNSIVAYTLTFVFGVMLLRVFHVDPLPLLTTASVAGLAVGFGAQKLVKDVISGFFILLENQYAVGEYVTINSITGTVEQIGMRLTKIRDDAGRLYILSNGDISLVCNQSRGAVAAFVEVGVAAGTDIGKATEVIDAAGQQLAKEQPEWGFAEPPRVQGLGAMDAARLTLRVACPVTVPARWNDAQTALRGFIHQKLTEAGIALA